MNGPIEATPRRSPGWLPALASVRGHHLAIGTHAQRIAVAGERVACGHCRRIRCIAGPSVRQGGIVLPLPGQVLIVLDRRVRIGGGAGCIAEPHEPTQSEPFIVHDAIIEARAIVSVSGKGIRVILPVHIHFRTLQDRMAECGRLCSVAEVTKAILIVVVAI